MLRLLVCKATVLQQPTSFRLYSLLGRHMYVPSYYFSNANVSGDLYMSKVMQAFSNLRGFRAAFFYFRPITAFAHWSNFGNSNGGSGYVLAVSAKKTDSTPVELKIFSKIFSKKASPVQPITYLKNTERSSIF